MTWQLRIYQMKPGCMRSLIGSPSRIVSV